MVSLPLYSKTGKQSGTIDAGDSVFGSKVKKSILHQAVNWHLASKRQGTSSSKTRAEVSGGGKKPWKQKGTGRARAGSIRSPLWRGGGVTFGPKPRDYSYNLPKKVRKLAINMAISEKAAAGSIKVIEEISIKEPKTKLMADFLSGMGVKSALLVLDAAGTNEKRAAANIEKIKLVSSKNLSVFDILNYEALIIDKSALSNLEERFKK